MANAIMSKQGEGVSMDAFGELESTLDTMRIQCDLMMDQIFNHVPRCADSSMRFNERMMILSRGLRSEIDTAQKHYYEAAAKDAGG